MSARPGFPKNWDGFPAFGDSPVSTPSRTPVPRAPGDPEPVLKEELVKSFFF